MLGPQEQVEADKGYIGEHPTYCRCYGVFGESVYRNQRAQKQVRARQEHINARLKAFKVLSTPFRDDLTKHGAAFAAVALVCQLNIFAGQRLWNIDYHSI